MAVHMVLDLRERRECERCEEEVRAMAEYAAWFGSTIEELFPKRFSSLPYPIQYRLKNPGLRMTY